MSDPIETYCIRHSEPEGPLLAALADETKATTRGWHMMVGPLEGALLCAVARAVGARRILEIGTFTGYSALWMARALPADGSLITCDVDPVSTEIAKRAFAKSPQGAQIRLELGDAKKTIASLSGPFDMAFIDADKEGYIDYWEACLPLVRPGGVIAVDNVLWSGRALAPEDEVSRAVAAFNEHAKRDARVASVMLPVRDGVLLATKLGLMEQPLGGEPRPRASPDDRRE